MADTNYDEVVPEALRRYVDTMTPQPEETLPSRWPAIMRQIALASYTWDRNFDEAEAEAERNYARTAEGGRLVVTHERPYVAPQRNGEEVVMLVGATEVLLTSYKVAELVKHLLEAGMAPAPKQGKPDTPYWQVVSAYLVVTADAGDSPAFDAIGSVELDPTNPVLRFATKNGHLHRMIGDQALAKVRSALGLLRSASRHD